MGLMDSYHPEEDLNVGLTPEQLELWKSGAPYKLGPDGMPEPLSVSPQQYLGSLSIDKLETGENPE